MTKVIGVRFKENGKSYYFNPKDLDIKENDNVIVETVRGLEFGKVVFVGKEVNEEETVGLIYNIPFIIIN